MHYTTANTYERSNARKRPAFTLCNYRCFFFSTTLPTSCNVNNFTTFSHRNHRAVFLPLTTLTHEHTLCSCMQFSLLGPSAICKLVLYTCVCALCDRLHVCVALSRRQFFFHFRHQCSDAFTFAFT